MRHDSTVLNIERAKPCWQYVPVNREGHLHVKFPGEAAFFPLSQKPLLRHRESTPLPFSSNEHASNTEQTSNTLMSPTITAVYILSQVFLRHMRSRGWSTEIAFPALHKKIKVGRWHLSRFSKFLDYLYVDKRTIDTRTFLCKKSTVG